MWLALSLAETGDVIFSDSRYAINLAKGIWRAKKHIPLVAQVQFQRVGKRVEIHWQKGHVGHPCQEEADRLAELAAVEDYHRALGDRA